MKFIGQYIQSLIARFRNDVYLEDVSTGTIVEGGNLGLDSNNKIVKANEASGVSLANGSDNRIVTATGSSGLNGEANFTYDGTDVACTADNFEITSANTTDPNFQLTNTTNDATGPRFRFLNNRSADGQDNDEAGRIEFFSYDDGTPAGERYAQIVSSIHDATSGEESGKLQLQVASHDGGDEDGLVLTGGSADAEVDVTVGNGSASVTTIAGTLTMGSTATLDNSGILQTAAQTNITSLGTLTNLQVDFINADGSTLTITDSSDTGDLFSIATTTHGATTLRTVDDDATAAHLTLNIDGNIVLDTAVGSANNGIILSNSGTQFGDFNVHHSKSYFTLYEAGGASLADYFDIAVAANGATSITTVDAAGTDANLTIGVDGAFSVSSTGIDIAADGTITNATWSGTAIATAGIADDAITFAKASGVSPKVFGSTIKILPSDFMTNDDGGSTKFGIGFKEDDSASFGMKIPSANTELLAFVSIPEGMKATHVDIFDNSHNNAIEVFEANVNSRTITSKGSGNCNTTLDITDVNATATNYLMILITTTATSDRTYGGTITIAAQ